MVATEKLKDSKLYMVVKALNFLFSEISSLNKTLALCHSLRLSLHPGELFRKSLFVKDSYCCLN